LKQISRVLGLVASLCSCTGADIENGALGGSEELVPAAVASVLLGT